MGVRDEMMVVCNDGGGMAIVMSVAMEKVIDTEMDEDDEKRHEGFDEKTSPSNHKWADSEHDLRMVQVRVIQRNQQSAAFCVTSGNVYPKCLLKDALVDSCQKC